MIFCDTDATGASVSLTVTVNAHAAVPSTFDAVHVTAFAPTGKAKGEVIATPFKAQVIVGVGRPEAETTKLPNAEHCPGSLPTVLLPGQAVKAGSGKASILNPKSCRAGLLIGSNSAKLFCAVELMPKDETVIVLPSELMSKVV